MKENLTYHLNQPNSMKRNKLQSYMFVQRFSGENLVTLSRLQRNYEQFTTPFWCSIPQCTVNCKFSVPIMLNVSK